MVETLFVQLGDALVNISKVRSIRPISAEPGKTWVYFDGPHDECNPFKVDCPMQDVQRMLAETYQQMAMMQAAANKAYGSQGGVH